MTVKHWNILLRKLKISSDKGATRQAKQTRQWWFNYTQSCLWAWEMDWISSSSAVGRHWHTAGDLDKAQGEFNLIFLLLPTFSPVTSLWKLFEECIALCLWYRRGAEPAHTSYVRANSEYHQQQPAGWTLVACSSHSPAESGNLEWEKLNGVGGYVTIVVQSPCAMLSFIFPGK